MYAPVRQTGRGEQRCETTTTTVEPSAADASSELADAEDETVVLVEPDPEPIYEPDATPFELEGPVTAGTYHSDIIGVPLSVAVPDGWVLVEHALSGIALLRLPSSGEFEHDVLITRPTGLADPTDPSAAHLRQDEWPILDIQGWIENLGSDIIVTAGPINTELGGRNAACGERFDRYVEVWQESTVPQELAVGEPPFTSAEFGAVVAAQDEWFAAVDRAVAASPGVLSGAGARAFDRAMTELEGTKYALDLLVSSASNPPNLVGAISRTQTAAINLIDSDSTAFSGCDSSLLQWPEGSGR